MHRSDEFDFSGDAVAVAYDNVLVPVLFQPWAERLAAEYGPWEDQQVLDLATGTGIVAQVLAERVGSGGRIIAADINPDMLVLARKRCSESRGHISFLESAAHPLEVAPGSIDMTVCQQGFQFFPEPHAAAAEIYRVLSSGGRVIASCWQDVDRCQYFGAVCEALRSGGEQGLADLMRRPFVQDGLELKRHFENAGFVDVTLCEQNLPLVFGSVDAAVDAVYSTPIGPKLRELTHDAQAAFRSALAERVKALCKDGRTMGSMVSNVVTARKQADATQAPVQPRSA